MVCERSGVVNVSIEGQFLTAAFAAAIVGCITKSIPAALIAAVLAGVVMAALLALFSIRYLVDQVVLGVVINLLAAGVTGFLFDQLVQPTRGQVQLRSHAGADPIPRLSKIPFFGRVLFEQTILAYLAGASVVVVWWLLFRTSWGLRSGPSASIPRRPTRSASASAASAGRPSWSRVSSPGWAARSSPWPRPDRSPRS